MNRCLRCCMPDTRPDTEFVDGFCTACLAHAYRPKIDWESRAFEFSKLLERHDGRCIVPSSGGKDSTSQVIKLLELGADVTIVTAATCYLTEIGRKNIENLSRFARTIEVTPNRVTRAKLNRIGFRMVGDLSWPEHCVIFNIPFKVAVSENNPLVIYGENPQNQYGGPVGSDVAKTMSRRWVSEFGGFLGLRPVDMVGIDGISMQDMRDYMPPSDADMQRVGVEAHFLGQYFEWDSIRNAQVAQAHGMQWELPCRANWWEIENLDNAMHGIHDHLMYRKFGYGRGCAQVSCDVRAGRRSREEAMLWIEHQDGLFPFRYMNIHYTEILQHIGMSKSDFWTVCEQFTDQSLFKGHDFHRPILKEFAKC